MKWWVNEIKLQNFTLNLNEKLYKPIFAKKIHPEYLENNLCNDDKICKKIVDIYLRIDEVSVIFLKLLTNFPHS